jgi:C2 domain
MSVAGVISLTIQSAHIRPWSTLLGGSPNPFVSVSINGGAEVGKTGQRQHEYVCHLLYTCNLTSSGSFNPSWMETKFVVLRSLDDTLTLSLFDHHEHWKHNFLGVSSYKLSKLREDAVQAGLVLSLLKNETTRGELLIDLIYYPLLQLTKHNKDFRKSLIVACLILDGLLCYWQPLALSRSLSLRPEIWTLVDLVLAISVHLQRFALDTMTRMSLSWSLIANAIPLTHCGRQSMTSTVQGKKHVSSPCRSSMTTTKMTRS